MPCISLFVPFTCVLLMILSIWSYFHKFLFFKAIIHCVHIYVYPLPSNTWSAIAYFRLAGKEVVHQRQENTWV